jgi:hypothetical protein
MKDLRAVFGKRFTGSQSLKVNPANRSVVKQFLMARE